MNKVQNINPQRIEWCCRANGLTVEDLSSKENIALETLEKAMRGEAALSVKQLRKIADCFNRGLLFFLEPGPVDERVLFTPQFRTIANQNAHISMKVKAIIERVEHQRDVFLSLREELGETSMRPFAPPGLPRNDPKHSAAIMREWLGLKERNDFNSYRAAVEAKGILVFRSNGYKGAWQIPKDDPVIGFSLYHKICPVIVVKKQDSESRQTFTLMHELGHIVLFLSSSIDEEADLYFAHDTTEQDANAFAGHLLVPEEFLLQIDDDKRPEDVSQYGTWLKDKRRTWGVSMEAILRRLMDEGRLGQEEYEAYRHWAATRKISTKDEGSRKYRHREPSHVFGDTFVGTVLDALNDNRISLNKASSYLDNIKIKDLHKLEGFYAGI